jgi:hypothetical protein
VSCNNHLLLSHPWLIAEVRQVKGSNNFAKSIKFHGSAAYRAENFSISDCAATEQSRAHHSLRAIRPTFRPFLPHNRLAFANEPPIKPDYSIRLLHVLRFSRPPIGTLNPYKSYGLSPFDHRMNRPEPKAWWAATLTAEKRTHVCQDGIRHVLARISDPRVEQFWDKDHLIAKQLDQQLSTSQPNCCRHAGILWDVAALCPKGVQWGGSQPVFVDGAVVKVEAELAKQLSATVR